MSIELPMKVRFKEWVNRHPFRVWRKTHGLSMRDACGMLGVGLWTVNGWEFGNNMPSPENMEKIIDLTKMPDMRERWAEWYMQTPGED